MDLVSTDKTDIKNVIENILYLGMPETARKTLCSECGKNKKKDKKGSNTDDRSI